MDKKCTRCTKWLLFILFATDPKTNALYAKCEKCRVKESEWKRKKYAADKAEREAVIEAGGKLVDCFDCGPQPLKAFGLHPTTGKPFVRCKLCNVKKNAYDAEYAKTELGKATAKRAKTSDKGKACTKRAYDHRQERIRDSTAMRMDITIVRASSGLISGQINTSPTFLERTSFESEKEFINVLEATFAPGMTRANHGTAWQVEHKIPRDAYDFDDPEDIKRCWSIKNVHTMTPEANTKKSWKLLDEYITAAGFENFPKAWNGKFPDAAFKAAHNAKMMAQKAIDDEPEEEPPEESPSTSNGKRKAPPPPDSSDESSEDEAEWLRNYAKAARLKKQQGEGSSL